LLELSGPACGAAPNRCRCANDDEGNALWGELLLQIGQRDLHRRARERATRDVHLAHVAQVDRDRNARGHSANAAAGIEDRLLAAKHVRREIVDAARLDVD
jgi:hypothetical protein